MTAARQLLVPGEHMGTKAAPTLGHQVLDGSLRILLAEGLILPTGLITAAFLTRHLGPTNYGLFTLASVVIIWVEFFVTSLFSRATIKLIGDTADWQPWAATIAQLHLLAGCLGALLLWAFSPALATIMHEPALAGHLRLFALDIPIFSLATAHRDILVGLRRYRERALSSATRWIVRLLLMILLISLGLSVKGAIWASIGASACDLASSRRYARPVFWTHFRLPLRPLWDYALPLLLSSIAFRLFDKLDLFVLKLMGASAALAGIYGAAQNLTIIPGLLATAFAPVLLAALTHALRDGEVALARALAMKAERLTVCLVPFAALIAGSAPAIATLVLGSAFAPAASFLALLIFAGFARLLVGVTTTILIAVDKPRWVLMLTVPLLPMAVAAQALAVLRWGPWGAAFATTGLAALLAVASVLMVRAAWNIVPSPEVVGKTVLLSVLAYLAAVAWPATGFLLLLKMFAISGLILAGYSILGDFGKAEIALLRNVVRSQLLGPS